MSNYLYIPKLIPFKAIQWNNNTDEVKEFVGKLDNGDYKFVLSEECFGSFSTPALLWNDTHALWLGLILNDWIIKGPSGSLYSLDPVSFEIMYEKWDDPSEK